MWEYEKEPNIRGWLLVKINGESIPLMWNNYNKFFVGFDGKTYKFNEIECWFDDNKNSLETIIIRCKTVLTYLYPNYKTEMTIKQYYNTIDALKTIALGEPINKTYEKA